VKSIETHARAFFPLNILAVGSVFYQQQQERRKKNLDFEFSKSIWYEHLLRIFILEKEKQRTEYSFNAIMHAKKALFSLLWITKALLNQAKAK
jgi:hypothetical protein